ncbi:MAG: gliding motility-associated C-terminal domain-containing protein, partial [Chitinophagaceae bacterium]
MFVILLNFRELDAQLCQGSLGDPIVNITFGSGANPAPALKAATTTYQYLASDCPGDGFYTVRNNTISCFGNTWHSLNSDHTGDPNGYFMLVNASFQPSAFYIDTVKGLCGNTTYEFAAWIANVLKPTSCSPNPIHPDLTFTLERTDGTVLQTYKTGAITTTPFASWKQYGFFFTMPANASEVVVRIFNNAQGGCGNDLALDDITFR